MRSSTTLLFVLTFQQCLLAQTEFHVCRGYYDFNKDDYTVDRVFAEDATSFFVQAHTGIYPDQKVLFNRYDRQTCAVELSKLLAVPGEKGKEQLFEGIQSVQGGMCLFSSYHDKKADSNTLYATRIDRDGNPLAAPVEIDVIRDVTNNKQGVYDVVFSRDRGRIATYRNINYWPKDPVKFTVKVMDAELKQIWSKEVQLPGYKGEDVVFQQYRVDNAGHVYMYVSLKLTDAEKALYPDNFYKQTILFFENGSGTMTQHDLVIPPGGGQRLGASFDFNDKQEVMVIGLVDEVNKAISTHLSSTYFAKFDARDPATKVMKVAPLSTAFLNTWLDDPKLTTSKRLDNYYALKLHALPDGGALGIFGDRGQFNKLRKEGNLIIIRYGADGSVLWERVILKDQAGNNRMENHYSHYELFDGNKLYFLYNDHKENVGAKTMSDIKPIEDYEKESTIVVRTVSLDGTVQDEQWAWPTEPSLLLVSHKAFYVNDDLFYFLPWEIGKCKGPNKEECRSFGRIAFKH